MTRLKSKAIQELLKIKTDDPTPNTEEEEMGETRDKLGLSWAKLNLS